MVTAKCVLMVRTAELVSNFTLCK